MKRIFLITAALVLTASVSQAGPVCDRIAARREARAQAKQSCPCPATPVRTAVAATACRVGQAIEAQPVRTFVGGVLVTAGRCVGGVCPR